MQNIPAQVRDQSTTADTEPRHGWSGRRLLKQVQPRLSSQALPAAYRVLRGHYGRYLRLGGNDLVMAAAAAGFPERITPMAEDEKPASGVVPRLVQEFTAQLAAITGRLEDLAGLGGGKPLAPGALPLPGGLSAAQMTSIAGSIAAQRRSIAALKAQLSSFDEQLAVLEQILGPLAEWSRTWAELEQRLLNLGRSPGAGK
jgi:hypothetical protein